MTDTRIVSPTIDPSELLMFKEFSRHWWDENSVLVGIKNQNHLRVPFICENLAKVGLIKDDLLNNPRPLQGLVILDVGCGGGFLSEELAKLGATVVGIDVSRELITVAKKHAALDPALINLSYHYDSVDQHVRDNHEKYDVVLALEVLDHVNEREMFLEECVKCLKPGGSVFISTFNRTVVSWFFTIALAEYVFRIIPRGAHHWCKFTTPEETVEMLEKYKCKKRLVRGMLFNNFNQHWQWTWFHLFSYIVHAVKDIK